MRRAARAASAALERTSGVWASAALVVLSVLAGLVLLEGLLFWAPELQAENPPEAHLFCEGVPRSSLLDQGSFQTEVPGSVYFERKSEADGWVVHFYNRDGFRDVFDTGTGNVIVLGDSFTRGTLVNNNDTYPDLLDLWHPDIAFRNFGKGGFGTFSELRVYRHFADRLPHNLVILGYFVGNDLTDNLREEGGLAARQVHAHNGPASDSVVMLVHRTLRNSRVYSLLYVPLKKLVTGDHYGRPLTPEEVEQALELTETALSELAVGAAAHGADLLITIIPSWNEFVHGAALALADRQRSAIRAWSARTPGVHVLDLKEGMQGQNLHDIYGKVDKHFSRYGQYFTARAIYEWINNNWSRGPLMAGTAPPFEPEPSVVVTPDCAAIPRLREMLTNPTRAAQEFVRRAEIRAQSSVKTPHSGSSLGLARS
jgi:hypothetical protein